MSLSPFPKNNRILVIDDNPSIHSDFKKILVAASFSAAGLDAATVELFGEQPTEVKSISFEIDSGFSGEEGLKLVQQSATNARPYALAFVDVRMAPGWDGIETTARIFQIDADIQIVICTAYSDYSWEKMIEKLGQSDRLVILKKPFDTVEVLQLAHAMTEKWELRQKARVRTEQLEEMVATRTRELQMVNDQLLKEMAMREQTEEALRQAQKMEAIGQLAGGIAHDFNNLLTVIRGYVQCLHSEMNLSPNVTEAIREIDAAAERAAKLTSQMLMFSRKKQMRTQVLNLNKLVTPLGTMLKRLLGENIAMDIRSGQTPIMIQADPVMIEMIILNLAVNARDAMPQGGCLAIYTTETEFQPDDLSQHPKARPGKFACIHIEDNGSGIAPEVLPHLFEPFFTTKEIGKGTGLGLASVYGVVKQHAGWIEVESQLGSGAKFKIFLPIVTPPSADIPPPPENVAADNQGAILLVEDERALRRLAKTVLQRHGFQVFEASSSVEAISVWNEHGPKINLLVTDMLMPGGMSGRELAEQLQGKNSELKVLYTSGYGTENGNPKSALKEGTDFLVKPYLPERLVRSVHRCLNKTN
jgi:signal transduction histidine kinase